MDYDEQQRNLAKARKAIDEIDHEIYKLLKKRAEESETIGEIKAKSGLGITQSDREREVLEERRAFVSNLGLSPRIVDELQPIMMQFSKEIQRWNRAIKTTRKSVRGSYSIATPTPWNVEQMKDVRETVTTFGLSEFDKTLLNRLGRITKIPFFLERQIVFAHRDYERVVESLETRQRVAIVSGFTPIGRFHFGHKVVVDQLAWYQKMGLDVFIPISDAEALVVWGLTPEEISKNTDEYKNCMKALGLDLDLCETYSQLQNSQVTGNSLRFSELLTWSDLAPAFGFYSDTKLGQMFYPLIQVTDILLPGIHGYPCTLVVCGIEQEPYIRVARKIADKLGIPKPAASYHKLLLDTRRTKKMEPFGAYSLYLQDDVNLIASRLQNALTGGRETDKEQKKLGGEPEKCFVYEFVYLHHPSETDVKEIYDRCKGGRLCGECKQEVVEWVKASVPKLQPEVG